MNFINQAHAASTTASSSVQLFNTVASTTGQIVQDSIPLFYIIFGFFIALFVILLILGAFRALTRTIKGR